MTRRRVLAALNGTDVPMGVAVSFGASTAVKVEGFTPMGELPPPFGEDPDPPPDGLR